MRQWRGEGCASPPGQLIYMKAACSFADSRNGKLAGIEGFLALSCAALGKLHSAALDNCIDAPAATGPPTLRPVCTGVLLTGQPSEEQQCLTICAYVRRDPASPTGSSVHVNALSTRHEIG